MEEEEEEEEVEGVGDPVTPGISGILLSLFKSPPLVSANSIVKNK